MPPMQLTPGQPMQTAQELCVYTLLFLQAGDLCSNPTDKAGLSKPLSSNHYKENKYAVLL